MIDKNQLCEKIRDIYPDIGECGVDINTEYDVENKRWVVGLTKGSHSLRTYLEDGDAEICLAGGQCVGLGIEVAQLKGNVERMQ